jgi:3-hydroxypropanoate dehydrogenase
MYTTEYNPRIKELSMPAPLTETAIDTLFRSARTYSAWQEKPVSAAVIEQLYDLAKMGATSANCCPMRVVFVESLEAKALLKPCLDAGNIDKTMQAPVTAIIAYDLAFYEELPVLFPHTDARSWFAGNEALCQQVAFRNGSLQGAYLMLAARSLGLDCGPMSGFDNQKLDATFFAGTTIRSNFLCNLGYGKPETLHPRNPRLDFDKACRVL